MPAGADFLAQIQGQNKQEHDVPARPAVNPLTAMLQKRNAGPPASINNQQTKATETTKRSSEFLFRSDQSKPFYFDTERQGFVFFAEHQTLDSFVPRRLDCGTIEIPLAPCIYRLTDYTLLKKEIIALQRCIVKLGVLRCLERECQTFNALQRTLDEDELPKVRFMELLSNCRVYNKVSELILQQQAANTDTTQVPLVRVDGLTEFLKAIEDAFPTLQQARQEILETQTVSFYPGLGELFSPGSKLICYPEGMEGSPLGCSCVQSWYSEENNPATNKIKRRFVLVLEFVVSVGDELVFVAATDVYPEFHDASRNAPIKDLTHRKLSDLDDEVLLQRLQQRGEFYASVATKNHYLEYHPDSFFPIISGGFKSNAVRPLPKGGRVMVDVKHGILEGHIPMGYQIQSRKRSNCMNSPGGQAWRFRFEQLSCLVL
jgi:hypothetical protein